MNMMKWAISFYHLSHLRVSHGPITKAFFDKSGGGGGRGPWRGLQALPPFLAYRKFSISELNLNDLVHILCPH